ncbi:hypothetical protein B0H13DRAFT_1909767 [Mycena leptocephala]|nr:hypothetical protein B0H13DRAFT_1909767 [Mycena leptocephala]
MRAARYQALPQIFGAGPHGLEILILEPILETSQLHVPRRYSFGTSSRWEQMRATRYQALNTTFGSKGCGADARRVLPGPVPQIFGAGPYGLEILILEPILETSQLHVPRGYSFGSLSGCNGEQMRATRYQASYPFTFALWMRGECPKKKKQGVKHEHYGLAPSRTGSFGLQHG